MYIYLIVLNFTTSSFCRGLLRVRVRRDVIMIVGGKILHTSTSTSTGTSTNKFFHKCNGKLKYGRRLKTSDKPSDYSYNYMCCPECAKNGYKKNFLALVLVVVGYTLAFSSEKIDIFVSASLALKLRGYTRNTPIRR